MSIRKFAPDWLDENALRRAMGGGRILNFTLLTKHAENTPAREDGNLVNGISLLEPEPHG